MARGGGCPDQDANDDVRVYLNCAGMALFVLSAITLVGAYGPYSWISPEDIQGVGGATGLMFVAPLAATLVVSGLQITSNRAGRNIPTAAEMTLLRVASGGVFGLLHGDRIFSACDRFCGGSNDWHRMYHFYSGSLFHSRQEKASGPLKRSYFEMQEGSNLIGHDNATSTYGLRKT